MEQVADRVVVFRAVQPAENHRGAAARDLGPAQFGGDPVGELSRRCRIGLGFVLRRHLVAVDRVQHFGPFRSGGTIEERVREHRVDPELPLRLLGPVTPDAVFLEVGMGDPAKAFGVALMRGRSGPRRHLAHGHQNQSDDARGLQEDGMPGSFHSPTIPHNGRFTFPRRRAPRRLHRPTRMGVSPVELRMALQLLPRLRIQRRLPVNRLMHRFRRAGAFRALQPPQIQGRR